MLKGLIVTGCAGGQDMPAARWAMVPGTQVALIRLSAFSQNAELDITAALQGAQAAGAKGLILERPDMNTYALTDSARTLGASDKSLPVVTATPVVG